MKTSVARTAVASAYRDLGRRGLIVGSAGNVSVRCNKGMVITPSGGNPSRTDADDMALTTLDGVTNGDITPSSEWSMHAGIYKAKPDAACIVHTHSDACTALACLKEGLPPFHYMVLNFGGGDVRCAPYVTFGTQALADLVVEAMTDRSACLLANHGMIVCGRDAADAVSNAVLLETLCRQYLLARSVGTPRLLNDEEIDSARERFKTYGPRPARK